MTDRKVQPAQFDKDSDEEDEADDNGSDKDPNEEFENDVYYVRREALAGGSAVLLPNGNIKYS